MTDFWLACGHHLTDRDPSGRLLVTDELLRAYLARPELQPPEDACAAERFLHAAILAEPRLPVGAAEIAAIADPDARENWQRMIGFRDHLLRHATLEAAYLALVQQDIGATPPLFLDQLVQLILRNALDGCDDPYVLRAAELFFRLQRATVLDGALLLADDERIAGADAAAFSPLGAMLGLPPPAELDVLTEKNAPSYWQCSDSFDMVLDLSVGRQGAAALATVIALWLRHMLEVEVLVEPLREMRDVRLSWYVGLDAEGTRIGDALWRGEPLDDATRQRVAALFRLTFADPRDVAPEFAHEAVYLLLAMREDRMLRLKPQNLLTGLPLRRMAGGP
ncbi:MAG TPA: DUF6352 family protein [Stellaceae bacterium]|nr:DUF6352 family protein [Stellaceae bacterium]